MSDLYTKDILRWTMKIPHIGHLDGADHEAKVHSRVCGSRITIQANVLDARLQMYAWEVKACALGQASAAIVGAEIVGASKNDIISARTALERQIKHGEAIDWSSLQGGKWSDLEDLAIVNGHSGRYGSVLLPFDAALAILEQALT